MKKFIVRLLVVVLSVPVFALCVFYGAYCGVKNQVSDLSYDIMMALKDPEGTKFWRWFKWPRET